MIVVGETWVRKAGCVVVVVGRGTIFLVKVNGQIERLVFSLYPGKFFTRRGYKERHAHGTVVATG